MNDIIAKFEKLKSNTERQNFENIWQDVSEFCAPQNDNITRISTPGEQKDGDRFIDIGLRSNRIFTSGMASNLIPAGSRFFEFTTSNPNLKKIDEVTRYWSEVTSRTYDILNASNFFQEVTKAISHLGYIGTCCVLAEPSSNINSPINFKTSYINQYFIAEDAYGMVDTVYFELKLTARQAYQLFGEDLSDDLLEKGKCLKRGEEEVIIIHAIEPRMNYEKSAKSLGDKRPIKSCYVELKTKHVIKNDGYYEMPYAVGRFYQSTNERYGRSPALECLATMNLVNRMEQTRIAGAERVSNPPWLSPNDGSVRTISNQAGSVIYWDAGNVASKPEQLTVKDNVLVNDQMIQIKNEEIEDAFFIPLFNPLVNRQNMTATESNSRVSIATQNLVPAIGRMTAEFLSPLFIRIYNILERKGIYPEIPQAILISSDKPQIGFSSKATMAIQQLELMGVYQTMENVTFLSQFDPNILDNFDMDEIARKTAEANSVPNDILKSEVAVKKVRKAREERASEERAIQEAQQTAEMYNKTSKTPEAGSGASMLMAEAGLL